MIESASREIQRAVEAAETRRREAARLPALIAALADLLTAFGRAVHADLCSRFLARAASADSRS
jgi:hypothetical protein